MIPKAHEHVPQAAGRGWWKLPLLGGVMLGIGYLPGPFLLFNLTAFVPLAIWLDGHCASGRYRVFLAGLWFGWATHLIALHFMYSMLAFSWLAALLYVAFSLALGIRIGLTVMLMGWLRKRTGLSWALLLPLCWLPVEYLQSFGDLRMTGEHLSHTVAGYPFLVQFADLLGPYGVGAVLLAVNGLLADVLVGWRKPAGRRAAVALVVLLAAVLGYDAWSWTRDRPSSGTLRMALIQPNIPLSVKHDASTSAEQWSVLMALTQQAAERGAELVVWPESARPAQLIHYLDRPETFAMPDVQALARFTGVSIITGVEYARARTQTDYDYYNAAVGVDAEGNMLEEWGAKVYLVPFTELLPFRGLLAPLVEGRKGEWRWVSGGFTPGPDSAVIPVAGARVGVLVCYEQLFGDLARRLRNAGAEFQVEITNDAWFARSLFQPYQANAARLRAIENRTAFVRVANTGISGFVDRRGVYHHRTELFEEAVEIWDVPRSDERTVFDRIGNVVAWLALAGLAGAIVLARRL